MAPGSGLAGTDTALGTFAEGLPINTSAAIWSGDLEGAESESTISIVVPVQLKRCGPAVRLIVGRFKADFSSSSTAPSSGSDCNAKRTSSAP